MIETLYPISGLFYYRLIFMAWLILAVIIFVFRLERRSHFVFRAIGSILASFLFAFIFPIPTANAFYLAFMFFVFYAFVAGCAIFCFKASIQTIIFLTVFGYTTEHISYEIYFAIANFVGFKDPYTRNNMYSTDGISFFANGWDEILYFVIFFVVYWIMFLISRSLKHIQNLRYSSLKTLLFGVIFIFVDIIFNSVVQYYADIRYDQYYIGIAATLNVLSCVIGTLFLFEVFYKKSIETDLQIMNELHQQEINQLKVRKETIDLINIKLHDMKHQIRKLGKEEALDEKVIENISKYIKLYDSSISTDNDALNVILTEKMLLCSNKGIRFSIIADANLISFIKDEDIYSLFGNLIDNSIEAVEKLDDEHKTITLQIKSQGNTVYINIKNEFEGKIEIAHGLPKSRKKNPIYHGFGLRSIQMIVQKYNGNMNFDFNNNVFNVTIVFIRENN